MEELKVWEEVDYDAAWGRFESVYGFRSGFDSEAWPAIAEPTGSIVYDLSPCADGSGTAEWKRHAVNFSVVSVLADFSGPDQPLLALDWQHAAYHFWPQRNVSTNPSEMMGMNHVTPVPDGDYYAFLDSNLDCGTFGHPWEQSLCVIGSKLVSILDPMLGSFLPVMRTHL